MRKTARRAAATLSFTALVGMIAASPLSALAADGASEDKLALGKAVAFDRGKGNCLACHLMDDGESPGNIGPPLVVMQARFPDKEKLRAQIWDATASNPGSRMPPFGKHKIITEEELDAIVDYLYTL